jgi:hypothetical protein
MSMIEDKRMRELRQTEEREGDRMQKERERQTGMRQNYRRKRDIWETNRKRIDRYSH